MGRLSFPPAPGDAGNWFLWAGDEITITWEDPPCCARAYVFIFQPEKDLPPIQIGQDLDPSNGIGVQWTLPEHLAGEFEAVAYSEDGSEIHAGYSGMVFTGIFPPTGICSMSSRSIGAVVLYVEPNQESADFSHLYPGEYAPVLGQTDDGWYMVDATQTHSTGYFDSPPAKGWVKPDPFRLHGPCDDLPLIEP